jgi:hypothetical protein
LTWQIRDENNERQREDEKAERKATLERAKLQQMFKDHDQQKRDELDRCIAENHAFMEEERAKRRLQAEAGRQANRLGEREKEESQTRAAARTKAQRQSARLAQRAGQRGGQ